MAREAARIVYLTDYLDGPAAGTEMQLLELMRGLDRTRFEPSLAVLRPTPFVTRGLSLSCPVEVLSIYRLASPHSWLRMTGFAASLRRRGVRLVHILFNDASVLAPPFCKLAGSRTVVARRDMGFWYTPAALRWLRVSNWFVDAIVANSEAVRMNVHRFERYPLARTAVLSNGHSPSRFLVPPRPLLREELGIAPGESVIGMVANLRPVKRHADLVRAFALLRARFPAHLLLVGGGEIESLRGLAAELGVASRVHFLGRCDDVIPVIKHFDVCVLCSESEGLSNAVLEYLGCGKPTVCTLTGGNPELIRDHVNGFLVPVGDVTALADRIAHLLSDQALARAMGSRAAEAFSSRFTSKHMVSGYMDLYDRLLSAAR